jgi:DNA modification methylase
MEELMKVIDQKITDGWAMYHGDSCEVIKGIPDNSIHYSIFSPPFASLFTYSDSDRDMGNNTGFEDFREHFKFLVPEICRVIMPGRLVSIHCMDLIATMTHDGFMGIRDFPGLIISMFESAGFIYHSRVCIWKDPLVQATRTKALSLAHKQISKDSTRCAMGLPDYIVTMRKPGDNPEPVSHGRGFERYIGEQPEPTDQKHDDARVNKYSHHVWQRYASPVWWDIRQTNTLNIQAARDEKDEKHICPLQLDTIARCLELWTNPGDTVLSPFAGIGSEGYQSVKMDRNFLGIELKESYYKQAVKNLESIDNEQKQISLF